MKVGYELTITDMVSLHSFYAKQLSYCEGYALRAKGSLDYDKNMRIYANMQQNYDYLEVWLRECKLSPNHTVI